MRTTVRLPAEGVRPHHDPTFYPVITSEAQILVKPLGTQTGQESFVVSGAEQRVDVGHPRGRAGRRGGSPNPR